MDDNKKKWIKRAIVLAVDFALALLIAFSRYNGHPADYDVSVVYALADGFFVIGFLNFSFGVLIRISTTGFFDIFSYNAKAILNFFIPRFVQKDEGGYYEYKARKAEKRKSGSIMRELIWIGLGLLLIALVFNILVYV